MAQDSLRRTEFVDTVTGSPTIHTVGSPTADYVHTAHAVHTHSYASYQGCFSYGERRKTGEDCGGCSEGVVGYWGARPGCVAYLVYSCN